MVVKNKLKLLLNLYLETPGLDKKIKFCRKIFLAKTSDALVEDIFK